MLNEVDWKICLEIGLNHLGQIRKIEHAINLIDWSEGTAAFSLQLREEAFYAAEREYLKLSLADYKKIKDLCISKSVRYGLALGPIQDLGILEDPRTKPDFIKVLSLATQDLGFMQRLCSFTDIPKYVSTGSSELHFLRDQILPMMRQDDMFIHTSLTHASQGQDLQRIAALAKLGRKACFGLHAAQREIIFAAIGAGAEKAFLYVGDKSSVLPDFEHAIDLNETNRFLDLASGCYSAMTSSPRSEKDSIKFIG